MLPRWTWPALTVAGGLLGLGLTADAALRGGPTYDEPAYLRVAARWWRTGDQSAITRMGSPLTFWKWQQVPTLWWLDHSGRGTWIDDPMGHQAELLTATRLGALPVWLLAYVLTTFWARQLHGPPAMALAGALFALSPNLIAHGSLVTMETPLVAATAGVFWMAWKFLETGRAAWGLASAAACGLAFSCKFTAILFPPILALAWWMELRRAGRPWIETLRRVVLGMLAFLLVMALADGVVTGFATIEPSERLGQAHPSMAHLPPWLGPIVRRLVERPWPQDWVGFANQMRHQRHGGPSYLLGERRLTGWWYYYLVALAVKVPLSVGLLVVARLVQDRKAGATSGDRLALLGIVATLAITSAGSTRNYGFRYLLVVAPLAIVWLSGLTKGHRAFRVIAVLGVLGQAWAVGSIHPHELSYFNDLAGGPVGGRSILADSCLDWGQGARSLARLQQAHPEYRDLTLYQFGDPEVAPGQFGVVGRIHIIDASDRHPGLPARFSAETRFVAVSASLRWGPWGPPDYFAALDGVAYETLTDDATIAIYRTAQVGHPQFRERHMDK